MLEVAFIADIAGGGYWAVLNEEGEQVAPPFSTQEMANDYADGLEAN